MKMYIVKRKHEIVILHGKLPAYEISLTNKAILSYRLLAEN